MCAHVLLSPGRHGAQIHVFRVCHGLLSTCTSSYQPLWFSCHLPCAGPCPREVACGSPAPSASQVTVGEKASQRQVVPGAKAAGGPTRLTGVLSGEAHWTHEPQVCAQKAKVAVADQEEAPQYHQPYQTLECGACSQINLLCKPPCLAFCAGPALPHLL